MMAVAGTEQTTRRMIYAVASAVGVVFTLVLVWTAWDSSIEQNRRTFLLETVTANSAVSGNLRSAHNAVSGLGTWLAVRENPSESELQGISTALLDQHPYISAVIFCRGDVADGACGAQYQLTRAGYDIEPDRDLFRQPAFGSTAAGPHGAAVLALPFPRQSPVHADLWLVWRLNDDPAADSTDRVRLVAVAVKAADLLANTMLGSSITVTLYSGESALSTRHVLVSREAARAAQGVQVAEFSDDSMLPFPGYSIRVDIRRAIGWFDVEKRLAYIAALIGGGITLLLVALARARDMQARELRERNALIERKVDEQTKELAVARDQALAASRIKSDFLASMSHEIRTPLNAIIGMAELLGETPLSGDQKKYVDVFRKAGDTLLKLVSDILDLSKIEAGQLELESIDFDLPGVLEESVEIYALKAAEKGVELVCDPDPALAPLRRGDPARLRQVVLNLISNALKFTADGEIVVSAEPAGGNALRLTVSDTGIGIPADKLETIFASFTQVDSSITRKYGGTGLGLTICRNLVEMMGGSIRVDSEVGRGSRFLVELELPPASIAPGPDDRRRLPGAGRLLIVDDSDAARGALRRILENAGADVIDAADPAAAEAALGAATLPGLALVDFRLPGTDGLDVVRRLRNRVPALRCVLMLSAAELNQNIARLKDLGVTGYLIKPVKRADLLDQVGELAAGDRPLRSETPSTPAAGVASRALRILLVDDNADNRLLVRAYLKNQPYTIDEADNGQLAVEKFQAGAFDLVLMDIQMPVLDGHAATRRIREWEQAQRRAATPIVALTAHAIKEEIDRCREAGCNAHLTKPVKKATLIETIEMQCRAVNGRRQDRPVSESGPAAP
jgi:signal transduction histidine kinase/CheY-like chemotaxis protein